MAYTRLTMIGSNRKADLVLPDDEPVGALLPQLLEVLDERIPGGREIALTTLTGVRIELDSTLGDQGVDHGTMIHLVPLDDAPHPPPRPDRSRRAPQRSPWPTTPADIGPQPERGAARREILMSAKSTADIGAPPCQPSTLSAIAQVDRSTDR